MKKILVVDDERHVRTGIAALLESAQDLDVEVILAEDDREASDLLNKQQFDLAIIDLRIPYPDDPRRIDNDAGIRLIQMMADQYPDLPVVVSTVRDDKIAKTQCSVPTVRTYLTKPIKSTSFLRTIRRLLGTSPKDSNR